MAKEFKIKNNEFLKSWIKTKREKILIKKLIQWHLDEQWKSIKEFKKSYNVKLIGDLPFYVSRIAPMYGVTNHYFQF